MIFGALFYFADDIFELHVLVRILIEIILKKNQFDENSSKADTSRFNMGKKIVISHNSTSISIPT